MKKNSDKNQTNRLQSEKEKSIFKQKFLRSRWQKVLATLSLIVVFCTVYALILPAASLTLKNATNNSGFYLDENEKTTENQGATEGTTASTASGNTTEQTEEKASTEGKSEELKVVRFLNGDLVHEGEDYTVTLSAKEAAKIPETARLSVSELARDSDAYRENLRISEEKAAQNESKTVSFARFFDITILDEAGNEIQPQETVSVKVTFKDQISVAKDTDFKAVHFNEEQPEAEVIEAKENSQNDQADKKVSDITFDANGFSVYGIVGTKALETKHISADGKTYTVTVTYDTAAGVPDNAELKVNELDPKSEEFKSHLATANELVASGDEQLMGVAKFFDIKILADGQEIQPSKPVKINIVADSQFEIESDSSYKAVHFGHNGPEVIEPEQAVYKDGKAEMTYTQEGFSVTGLVTVRQLTGAAISTRQATIADVPGHKKTLTPNGDGSYKLSLDVTGAADTSSETNYTKANVLVIFDTSNSMRYDTVTGQEHITTESKLTATKRIVKNLATNLFKNNTTNAPDAIEMALIAFDRTARHVQDWTTSANTFNNKVDGLEMHQGTNWQHALKLASEKASDGDPTYVIFVTDGLPTRYFNSSGNISQSSEYDSYLAARPYGKAIVDQGRVLYGVFAYLSPDPNQNYLDNLLGYSYNSATIGRRYYHQASDTSALERALKQIQEEIVTKVGYKNVKISDGLTSMTGTTLVPGTANNFTYTRSGGNYGSGTNWTNAPRAVFNNRTIEWDLSSLGTLEDGVTYTVSFTVWPNQDSYDLVAGITNGNISYDSLSPEQKSQLIQHNGGYALKTNTTAKVDYKKVKTVNGQEVEGDDGSVPYPDPNPMPLIPATLTLKKEWKDDALTGGSRPSSVTMWVKSDNVNYKQVTLTAAEGWTANVAVAPGLYVRPGDHGTASSGADAGKLTSGHIYTVSEVGVDPRYDAVVDSKSLQPMLDGTTKSDTTDIIDYLTKNKWTNDVAALKVTNTIKGLLKIDKVVTTKDDASDSISVSDTFTITASLKDSAGQPLSTVDYNNNQQVDTDELYYEVRNESDHSAISSGSIQNGSLSLSITTEQYIAIFNIPSGTQYSVTEDTTSLPAAYRHLKTDNAAGTIAGNKIVFSRVYNKRSALGVEIEKVDVNNPSKKLEGAQFALYKSDGETPATDMDGNPIGTETVIDGKTIRVVTTGSDGKASLAKLTEGTYILKEVRAPAGYILAAPIEIIVSGNKVTYIQQGSQKNGTPSADGLTFTLTITNSTGHELPMTGGPGTLQFTISGLLLIATALVCGLILWRRAERRGID